MVNTNKVLIHEEQFRRLAAFYLEWTDSIKIFLEEQAERRQRTVSFEGAYLQGTRFNPDNKMAVVFLIAQTEADRKSLDSGLLFGEGFDEGRVSVIDGTISPQEVKFKKVYTDEKISRPIFYSGRFSDGIYKGEWNFTPLKKPELQTSGEFFMRRVC